MDTKQHEERVRKLKEDLKSLIDTEDRKALPLLYELLDIGSYEGDDDLIGYANYYIGEFLFFDGRHIDEIIAYFMRAMRALQNTEDIDLLARAYNMLGIIETLRGNAMIAVDYYLNAIHLTEDREENAYIHGCVSSNLAHVYESYGDYETAIDIIKRSMFYMMEEADQARFEGNRIHVYTILANCYLALQTPQGLEMAEFYLKQSEPLLPRISGAFELACVIQRRIIEAKISIRYGEVEKAKTMILEVLPSVYQIEHQVDYVEDLCLLGDFLITLGMMEESKQVLDFVSGWDFSDEFYGMKSLIYALESRYYDVMGDVAHRNEAAWKLYQLQLHRKRYDLSAIKTRVQVDELKEQNEKLRHLAEYDELTSLPNRYHMNQYVDLAFEKAHQQETSFAIGMLDIDFFKEFNDSFGHQFGDLCLQEVAREIRNLCEQHDGVYAARFGGDEFLFVYENYTNEQIAQMAGDLSRAIRQIDLTVGEDKKSITVSQGICNGIPDRRMRFWDYETAADHVLYEVKNKKRGNVMVEDVSSAISIG